MQIHLVERQRRCPARFVDPGEAGRADLDLLLGQQPVGEAAARPAGVDGKTGDGHHALGVVTDREVRPIDHQRVQAYLAEEDRTPREHRLDMAQFQRRSAFPVVDGHAVELETGAVARPRPRCVRYGDSLSRGTGHAGFDPVAVPVDVRQHVVPQA